MFLNTSKGVGVPYSPPSLPVSYFAGDFATRALTSAASWPAALYDSSNDKTYFGWVAEGGPIVGRVWAYDHTAETFVSGGPITIDDSDLVDDDHGPVILEQLSDGRLVAFWGSHNSDQQWAICSASSGVPDIADWTINSRIAGDYTYPKPVNIPDGSGGGTLHLFMRKTTGTSLPLVVRSATYTSGGAVSFGAETELINISGHRVYASEVRPTDATSSADIEFMFTLADTGDTFRRDVLYAKYIVSTGAIENLSGGTSVASGSLPVTDPTDFIEEDTGTNDTGFTSWCRDGSGNLHVLYGNDNATIGTAFDIYHKVHNGSSWGSASTIFSVIRKTSGGFVENFCLVPLSGASVEAWYPAGNTGSWTGRGGDNMARKVYASSTWGSEEIIVTGGGTYALGQPGSVRNGHADFRLMFGEVSQGITKADAFISKRYAYGDSGFLQFPALNNSFWPYVVEQVEFTGTNGTTPTDLDASYFSQPTVFANGATIQSNRLDLDGANNKVTVGSASVGARRYNFDGAFAIIVSQVRFDTLSQNQTMWGLMGGAGDRGIMVSYRGADSPRDLRIDMSSDTTAITSVDGTWEPADTVTEYDFVFSRDASNNVRIHAGETGGALTLVGSGTWAGTIAASSLNADPPRYGLYDGSNQQPMDGAIGGVRVIGTDMGITDADYTPAAQPWDTN